MNHPVRPEFSWMENYFKKGVCREFLKYFSLFGSVVHFSEHTGLPCSLRWGKRMQSRFLRLSEARNNARKSMDFELLTEIETGSFKLD